MKRVLLLVGVACVLLLIEFTITDFLARALVFALGAMLTLAWLSLCGTLQCCERAIDAMLSERYATLRATFGAALRQRSAGNARANEVQR